MKHFLQRFSKGLFLIALAFSLTFAVLPEAQAQQTIDVQAGTYTINDALQQASSGDTLKLVTDGGLYEDSTVVIDKNITIIGDAELNEPPTVVWNEADYDPSSNFAFWRINNPTTRVTLKHFTIGREVGNTTAQPNNLIFHAADSARTDLFIHGMELRNTQNKALANNNDENPAVYDSLVVTRTYAHNHANNVFDLKANSTPEDTTLTANYVKFENVTIAKTTDPTSAIGFMTKGGQSSPDSLELHFNHVTMDSVKIGMNINQTPTSCSRSEIKNSVITRTQDGSKPAIRWNGLCQFTVDHMVTYQTGGFGGGNISSTNSLQWSNLNYQEPGTGNYALQNGVPGTESNQPATDGSDRGDLKSYNADTRIPVELANFQAVRSANAVQLKWQTASETNNARFEVMRDAGDGWKTIGQRPGAGTTSEAQSYTFTDDGLPFSAEVLHYRLRQVDLDGSETVSDVLTVELDAPQALLLQGAAPNPFRNRTTVRYSLPSTAQVTVAVFDVLGRRVSTLVDAEEQGPGPKLVSFDAENLPSGTYFVRVNAGDDVKTKKMTLVR